MGAQLKLTTGDIEWQPVSTVFDDYQVPPMEPPAGVFVKVLRRPTDGGGCWHCLLRFRPPPGHAIRITAVARSDEEVYILSASDGRDGMYSCNPAGLRHGQTLVSDTVALVHYHGQPDEVLRAEVVALGDLAPS